MAAAPSSAARRLFGTDGVRGVAGEFLTAELALSLARAATARVKRDDGRPARVLIIRDTRESGEMLEAAVAAGVAAAGGEALLGGILPTPGAPLLIERHGFDLGVVLSALAQPVPATTGSSSSAATATSCPTRPRPRSRPRSSSRTPSPSIPGRVRTFHGALEDYLRALQERFADLDLTGQQILLDCANGATFRAAPGDLPPPRRRHRGARPRARRPQHQRRLRLDAHRARCARRMQTGDDIAGFAFDGDGDRMLAVDRNGIVVDGDELIALAAIHLREAGRLPGNGVAVTVMTNYGFHTAMREHGVEVAITGVGDRYVLEALRERDWALGGEQSGHIIDRNFVPSGDGIAAALLTLEALDGADLADRHAMEKLPQTARQRARARPRGTAGSATEVHAAVERESAALEGPRPRAAAPERHRAARARDGRGADRRRGRWRLRPARRARRVDAQLRAHRTPRSRFSTRGL